VCTAEKREKNNIIDFIDYPVRIFPVGRLDKESRGLIFLTNDGELSDALMRSRNGHEREYEVTVDRTIDRSFIDSMEKGVYLSELSLTTLPARVKKLSSNRFSIILTQGLNRQIRRMCETLGYRVRDLKRIRIENVRLGDLPEGQYRKLSEKEEEGLRARLSRGSEERYG
ncbi:MAG: pseudouridine synthase, partial [Lachnospiraceae bacterium]|nr:pseudouridine synthase [Lachnospiraceae bacterium]